MIGATVSWHGQNYEIKDILPYDGWFDWSSLFSAWGGEYAFTRQTDGYHDPDQGGIWVPGEPTETEIEAIILPLSKSDLKYDVGGSYTRQDVKVYVQCPGGGFRVYFARRIKEGNS
jgi:hypothetical protein